MLKKIIILLFLIAPFSGSQAQNADMLFFKSADMLFQKSVKSGLVDYKTLKSEPKPLDDLIKSVASYNVGKSSPAERKAFYINAYNLLVIKSIVDHYPTKSPMKIQGFFDRTKHVVAGEKLTLNELEKEKLLKTTGDARLHFVLVCAAIGCPKLANHAYLPNKLEPQIQQRTQAVLSDNNFIRKTEKQILVSEIFKWYESDFKKDAGSVVKFINKYSPSKVDAKAKLGYYTYDWTLNAL